MMFDPRDLSWVDFEVASRLDLKAAGTLRYATDVSTRAIILAYAVGDAPELTWHADGAILDWDNAPDDLRAAYDRGATFAAGTQVSIAPFGITPINFPFLAPERVIDVMIQAGVSNLPTDLERLAHPRWRRQTKRRQEADQTVLCRRRRPPPISRRMAALSR